MDKICEVFFFNGTGNNEIYTPLFVGRLKWGKETGPKGMALARLAKNR